MSDPLVSVVIPVYNGAGYLPQTLKSVLGQTYRPIEIIVVDDGSTDGSDALIGAHQGITLIQQENQGVAAARNRGIVEASGEFIAFLDQDDVWTKNKLSKQVDYLMGHEHVGIIVARQQFFVEPGIEVPQWLKTEILLNDHMALTPSSLVARRSVFDKIGTFVPELGQESDTHWFMTAKDHGIPIVALREVLLHRRIHRKNQSYQARTLGTASIPFDGLPSSIYGKVA